MPADQRVSTPTGQEGDEGTRKGSARALVGAPGASAARLLCPGRSRRPRLTLGMGARGPSAGRRPLTTPTWVEGMRADVHQAWKVASLSLRERCWAGRPATAVRPGRQRPDQHGGSDASGGACWRPFFRCPGSGAGADAAAGAAAGAGAGADAAYAVTACSDEGERRGPSCGPSGRSSRVACGIGSRAARSSHAHSASLGQVRGRYMRPRHI